MAREPTTVRHALLALLVFPTASALAAQAPPGTELWRVAALSVPVPTALADGPAGGFWNPGASAGPGRMVAGVHLLGTSDELGLSGLLAAVARDVTGGLRVGLSAGRVQMRDLVRTTTSPNSESGVIPVYVQAGGVSVALARAGVRVGTVVRFHDDRFDVLRENGVTVDVGVVVEPIRRVRLAAATHFLPWTLRPAPTTDLYAGAEVVAAEALPVAGVPMRLTGRYGASFRPEAGDAEHALGVGIGLGDKLWLDIAGAREVGPVETGWRPVLGVGLRVGRYVLTAAQGLGLHGVGGTYRIGLDVDLSR